MVAPTFFAILIPPINQNLKNNIIFGGNKMNYTIEAKHGKEYDVIVCGAGTAGVMAAIAAGRQGAKTLLIERSFHVGGMLTEGNAGITKFTLTYGRDIEKYRREVTDVLATDPRSVQVAGGIAHEFCMRMIESGGAAGTNGDCGAYVFTERYAAEIMLLDMLKEANVDILYDSRVCVVDMDGDTLKKVVVANKSGFVEYAAKCFIDSTGDADVAAISGVEFSLGANQRDVEESGGRVKVGDLQDCGTMYRVDGVDFDSLFEYFETHPGFTWQACALMTFDEIKERYAKGEMCCFSVPITNPDPDTRERTPRVLVQIYVDPSHQGAILLSEGKGKDSNTYNGDGTDAVSLSEGQTMLTYGARAVTEILRREYPAGFANARVIHVPDIGVRETRHIVGKYTITAMDVMTGGNFEDSIGCSSHHVDGPGMTEELRKLYRDKWMFHIPYRIMLPEKVKNLLVAGRAASATKTASGALRVTVSCMQMGEAAGVAAAMAAKQGISPDEIDVKAMQRILLDGGAII